MKARNVLNRIHGQRLLSAAALLGVSLTANAAGYGIDRARGNAIWDAAVNGRTTTLGLAGQRMEVIRPPSPVGQGNGSVKVSGSGTLPVGGVQVPVTAGGTISKEDIIGTVAGCLTGGLIGCAIGIATPIAIGYMAAGHIRLNPNTNKPEIQNNDNPQACDQGQCYEFASMNTPNQTWGTATYACQDEIAYRNQGDNGDYRWNFIGVKYLTGNAATGGAVCMMNYAKGSEVSFEREFELARRVRFGSGTWEPATSQAIKDALYNHNPPPELVDELAKHGNITWPLGDLTLTGPGMIYGPKETTTNPDGSTSTRQTSTPITYDGGKATSGNPTTSTTKRNTDGTDGGTTTTTTEPGNEPGKEEQPPKDPCDEHPDRVGCLDIDTPELEIPRDSKTITFAAEDPFGGGSCPVDQTMTLQTTGQTVKVTNWAQMCDWSLPLRGIVIALATFAAFLIIMPGETRV